MGKIAKIGLVTILLAGCATTPSLGLKSLQLQSGMTKSEVQQILGTPKMTSVRKSGESTIETWNYWSKTMMNWVVFDDPMISGAGNRLSVTFENGKVKSWGDQYDFANIGEETGQAMAEAMKNLPPIKVEQTVYNETKGKKK